jgi:hypothetical protein
MDPLNDLFAEHPQFRDGPNWICVRVRLSKSAETCELRPCWPEKLEVDEFHEMVRFHVHVEALRQSACQNFDELFFSQFDASHSPVTFRRFS